MKKLRVLYHDNCFDGLASAAVFSSFYRGKIAPGAEIEYEGLTHKAGQLIDEDLFGDEENVIVDFKYSASDKLTWWFDHHAERFPVGRRTRCTSARTKAGEKFHDPDFKSCTKFIASVAKDTFGYEDPQPGGTRALGGHHRRRPVSQRAVRGGVEGAGDAVDDRDRGNTRPQPSAPNHSA